MRLDDVDLGKRRLPVAGRIRPLDDLTHHAVASSLEPKDPATLPGANGPLGSG